MAEAVGGEELAARYRTWQTADLLRATTVEASTYSPEALVLLHRELVHRGCAPAEPQSMLSAFDERAELRGVKGFLALMVFAIGLRSVLELVQAAIFVSGQLSIGGAVLSLVHGSLGLFGLATGVLLLRVDRRAPRIATAWFIALLVAYVAMLLFVYWISGQVRWRSGAPSLFFPLVWLEYLRLSRRVKATYGSPLPPEAAAAAAAE
jgi:hypothetical protein